MAKTILIRHTEWSKTLERISSLLSSPTYQNNCGESSISLPSEFGNAHFHGANFLQGLGLFFLQGNFAEPTRIVLDLAPEHPLLFTACYRGKMIHRFDEYQLEYQLIEGDVGISAGSKSLMQEWEFLPDEDIAMVCLTINRADLLEKIACKIQSAPKELMDLLQDTQSEKPYFCLSKYGDFLTENFQNIFHNAHKGFARSVFLEGQALELFAAYLHQFRLKNREGSTYEGLHQESLKQIQEARNLMRQQLGQKITIRELARQVGVSTTKLQTGFKLLTGQSIGQFLRRERMKQAALLLQKAELPIKEISQQVGYENHGHFSHRFKEYHGFTPSEFRKKIFSE